MVWNFRQFLKHEKQQQEKQEKSEEKTSFIPTCFQCENKRHIRPNSPLGKEANKKNLGNLWKMARKLTLHRKTMTWNPQTMKKPTYVSWKIIKMMRWLLTSLIKIFFCISKKLTKQMSKLEQIVSISKDTISSLDSKNKNFVKEI